MVARSGSLGRAAVATASRHCRSRPHLQPNAVAASPGPASRRLPRKQSGQSAQRRRLSETKRCRRSRLAGRPKYCLAGSTVTREIASFTWIRMSIMSCRTCVAPERRWRWRPLCWCQQFETPDKPALHCKGPFPSRSLRARPISLLCCLRLSLGLCTAEITICAYGDALHISQGGCLQAGHKWAPV